MFEYLICIIHGIKKLLIVYPFLFWIAINLTTFNGREGRAQ